MGQGPRSATTRPRTRRSAGGYRPSPGEDCGGRRSEAVRMLQRDPFDDRQFVVREPVGRLGRRRTHRLADVTTGLESDAGAGARVRESRAAVRSRTVRSRGVDEIEREISRPEGRGQRVDRKPSVAHGLKDARASCIVSVSWSRGSSRRIPRPISSSMEAAGRPRRARRPRQGSCPCQERPTSPRQHRPSWCRARRQGKASSGAAHTRGWRRRLPCADGRTRGWLSHTPARRHPLVRRGRGAGLRRPLRGLLGHRESRWSAVRHSGYDRADRGR